MLYMKYQAAYTTPLMGFKEFTRGIQGTAGLGGTMCHVCLTALVEFHLNNLLIGNFLRSSISETAS